MTQCVSDAALWDPYLPSWLHCFWGPRTQQKHKQAGPGRVASRAQINRPEIRVLRKQTDPAGRAVTSGRSSRQRRGAGGEESRSLASTEVNAESACCAGGTRDTSSCHLTRQHRWCHSVSSGLPQGLQETKGRAQIVPSFSLYSIQLL